MLSDILKNKECFKLVCGAGNEDVDEIEKLVALYSKAGCKFFDLCAKSEIIEAAKRGVKRAKKEHEVYLCISIGNENDQHFCKAEINQNCINCGKCKNVCLQNAIDIQNEIYTINEKRCIGCGKCINNCPANCIKFKTKSTDFTKILPPLIQKGIDCIEFHVIGNEKELYTRWKEINTIFDGLLSISINRAVLGDTQLIETIQNLIKTRKPYTTIIQADGIPMSGGKDDYGTTLQAVAIADVVKGANLPVYVITSGGTNSKTTELTKMCNIDIDGIAIGSYARKIVKEFTQRNDFFENEQIFNEALKIAKQLVDISLNNLK